MNGCGCAKRKKERKETGRDCEYCISSLTHVQKNGADGWEAFRGGKGTDYTQQFERLGAFSFSFCFSFGFFFFSSIFFLNWLAG